MPLPPSVSPSVIATGLSFPEGPVALPDGSILVVEVKGGRLTRVSPDGEKRVVAVLGGGPNGAAIGPDGRCYICNNGGLAFQQIGERLYPSLAPKEYTGGWIEAVDLTDGKSEVLYRDCDGSPLRAPNDLVFDATGGFWFSDTGKTFADRITRGGIYYARPDGSSIRRVISPIYAPNGIGLSPDGGRLYVADTFGARLFAYELDSPGRLARSIGGLPWERGKVIASGRESLMFDSLAVDAEGQICVADIPDGGISTFSPEGEPRGRHTVPGDFTTNICFGGADLRTAYITLSSSGSLLAAPWRVPGLALHWSGMTDGTSRQAIRKTDISGH